MPRLLRSLPPKALSRLVTSIVCREPSPPSFIHHFDGIYLRITAGGREGEDQLALRIRLQALERLVQSSRPAGFLDDVEVAKQGPAVEQDVEDPVAGTAGGVRPTAGFRELHRYR